jgi:peptide/nickel transport system substrate-binding protein
MAVSGPIKRAVQALASAALVAAAIAIPARAASPTVLVLGTGPYPTFVRNFNPFSTNNLPWTIGAIYEPLYMDIYVANGKQIPWLATSYRFSHDLRTLTFTIRQGVKWSDGQPFTARDVLFTLNLAKKYPAARYPGQPPLFGPGGLATSVDMPAANQVAIHFKTADSTIFGPLVNNFYPVPAHIWSGVKDPVTFLNPNPVGTGPFTQVQNFSTQSFDLARNPYYWQAATIKIDVLRFPAFTSNDSANLASETGKLDWASIAMFNPYKVYVARNPRYFHFATVMGSPTMLQINTTKYPLSLPAFRKALSMALNRRAISLAVSGGIEPPADSTGLTDATGKQGPYPSWRDPSIPNTLVQYNPAAARALLRKAGFTYKGGKLLDPKGAPVSLDMPVPAPFTDWVAAFQVEAQNFRAIGIDATVRLIQPTAYFDRLNKGTFDVGHNFTAWTATPYDLYHDLLSSDLYEPIGTLATGDQGRYRNPALDKLFLQFRMTTDLAQQHSIMTKIERNFLADLPAIPLYITVSGNQVNTERFTGFPLPPDVYAVPSTNAVPDYLLVLTHLRPRQGHG